MKYMLLIIVFLSITSAYAINIKVGEMSMGDGIGVGTMGMFDLSNTAPVATFWNTSYTDTSDWAVAYGLDWTEPYNTEVP